MDYLDKQRFFHESANSDVEKVWLIADHDNEDVAGEYDSFELALKGYNSMLKGNPEADIELGWMWEHNKCPYADKDFKSHFNTVELEVKQIA